MSEGTGRHDRKFQAISDWLIESALGEIDLEERFLEFCRRLYDAGIPLKRGHLATRTFDLAPLTGSTV